jgi:tetratricopeptide (TPR) repeat protein
MRPAGNPRGPFAALAGGLTAEDALPELLTGQNEDALAAHLETAAADPSFPMIAALNARQQAAHERHELLTHEHLQLVLVVDQLEELFTLGEVSPQQRTAFIACLQGLIRSGRIIVVATMRSDYWHRAAEVPQLVALAEGRGRFDLIAPSQSEITEMIRRPAEAAGLAFEQDPRTEIALDAALAEEAAHEPGALPLLSFLLDALYAQDVQAGGNSRLTYASARALGGLKGAIANRAEAAFTSLPVVVQNALPRVLRILVTVSRSGVEPTARGAPMSRFADGTAERRIVDALLDPEMRLLVAEGDGAGAVVRLAHEALITHWDRAKRLIAQDRDDLRTRTAVEEAETEWRLTDARRKRGYLLRDPRLAQAIDLATRWGDELDADTRSYIAASRRNARLRQQLAAAAALVFGIVAVGALIASVFAYRAQQQADAQRTRAETSYAAAKVTVDGLIFNIAQGLANIEGMRTDTIAKILDTAKQTVDKLVASNPADPALQRSRASMLVDFARIYLRAGDAVRALPNAIDALAIYRKLAAADPGNVQRQRELGSTLGLISVLKRVVEGDAQGARQAAEENLAIRRKLAELNDIQYQADLAHALYQASTARRDAGNAEGARKAEEESVAIRRRLLARNPDNAEWRRDLSESLSDLQLLLVLAGDFEGANKLSAEALDVLGKLNPGDPSNTTAQQHYAADLDEMGDLQLQQGDTDTARKSYEESFAIRQRLAARDPEHSGWQRDIAKSLRKIGDWKLCTGDKGGAVKSYQDGIDIRRKLVTRDPSNSSDQFLLAADLANVAELHANGGNLAAAFKIYLDAVDIERKVAERNPSNSFFQISSANRLNTFASLQLRTGDREGARKSLTEQVAILRRESARDPSNALWRGGLAAALNQYGKLLEDLGDLASARTAYDESLALMREASARDPGQNQWTLGVAASLGEIGALEIAANDVSGARKTFDEQLLALRRLTAMDPSNTDYLKFLSLCLGQIGELAFAAGEPDKAGNALREAVGIRRALAERDPANNDQPLVTLLSKLANLNRSIGQIDDAREIYRGAFEILRGHVRAEPASMGWERLLADVLQDFGDMELGAHQVEPAVAALEEGLDIRRKLVAAQPGAADLRAELAASLLHVAGILSEEGKFDEALADYDSAIELGAHIARANFGRGKVQFYAGQFAAAAESFAQSLARVPIAGYAVIWLHLARMRSGADDHKEFVDNIRELDHAVWPWPIVELYLGSSSPEALYAAAIAPKDETARHDRTCEADFYLGEWTLQNGDHTQALRLLKSAADTCAPGSVELSAAKFELQRISP